MSILDPSPRKPTAEEGAQKVRQAFRNSIQQMEVSLQQVGRIVGQFGRFRIKKALGRDAQELQPMYRSMRLFVEKHKRGAKIKRLPR